MSETAIFQFLKYNYLLMSVYSLCSMKLQIKKKACRISLTSLFGGVEGGARTHDIQNHNLTL